jgi:uncharacterized membrane protein YozB (DUF420 family)
MRYRWPALLFFGAVLVAVLVLGLMGRGSGSTPLDLASKRPLLHALLNACSALAVLAGFVCIRLKLRGAHAVLMIVAGLLTLAFLASYLQYHYVAGSTPFRGQGPVRLLYFGVLISHTILAAVCGPLVLTVYYLAARRRFERHRRVARWTLPLWLYVSLTGVLVYLMLYVWFASP